MPTAQATDGVIGIDRNWRYTYLNDQALWRHRATASPDLTRESILGESIWDFYPDAQGTEIHDLYKRAMDDGIAGTIQAYFRGYWMQLTAEPCPDGIWVSYQQIEPPVGDCKVCEEEARVLRGMEQVCSDMAQALPSGELREHLLRTGRRYGDAVS